MQLEVVTYALFVLKTELHDLAVAYSQNTCECFGPFTNVNSTLIYLHNLTGEK